jgi:HSP20 family protein
LKKEIDTMIIRRNPWREMEDVRQTMDRLFDETWRPFLDQPSLSRLELDITETANAYTVKAALPGLTAEDISINLHDNVLTIEGESRSETQQKATEGQRVLLQELRYGKVSRSLRLPHLINSEAVEANYENGILHLTLPKNDDQKPRRILVGNRPTIADTSKN